MTYTVRTDKGRRRDHNEDSFVCESLWGNCILAIVIDGVGGYEGGEVAAQLAASTIKEYLSQTQAVQDVGTALVHSVIEANNVILSEQFEQPQYKDMACVLTAVIANPEEGRMYMSHIGDTRLYEFDNGMLNKLSHDHSPVGMMEEKGLLTEEEAMNHPRRNVIERCLGQDTISPESMEVESAVFTLKKGATYLLCSDGLTDMINRTQIIGILSGNGSLEEKTEQLIDAANEAGGKDNITVLLLQVPAEPVAGQVEAEEEEAFTEALVDNASLPEEAICEIPDNAVKKTERTSESRSLFSSRMFHFFLGMMCMFLLGIIVWAWYGMPEGKSKPEITRQVVKDTILLPVDTLMIYPPVSIKPD